MKRGLIAALLYLPVSAFGQFADPFEITVRSEEGRVAVEAKIPENHLLYVDHFKVTDLQGHPLNPLRLPESEKTNDAVSGKTKRVYVHSFEAFYAWPETGSTVVVSYMGCNDQTCFMPETKRFELAGAFEEPSGKRSDIAGAAKWKEALLGFEIRSKRSGYMDASTFLGFLDEGGDADQPPSARESSTGFRGFLKDSTRFMQESGTILTLLFILMGGLALNLTPCVLPMVPINLAIIGAGARSGSKSRGFALGATYGLGIALTYGLLGVAVVLTGAQFGTIQANPWFNAGIAILFLLLALAMFDLFAIDLSRLQNKLGGSAGGAKEHAGSFSAAFLMGAVAALLAGACVAPVVIAVLLLAADLYPTHPLPGLALPFVLGLGMALPWPFAGAGLSFLPKPGKWMSGVKKAFGLLIALLAFHYARLAVNAFRVHSLDPNASLVSGLAESRSSGKPVLIDFGASWCKNCAEMEKKTFKDPNVRERLKDFVVVHYAAEQPSDSAIEPVLRHFGVMGLPSFVLLHPPAPDE